MFKGGKKFKRGSLGGHILLYSPNHPNAKKNFVPEHRIVLESQIGRYLLPNEVVHHIDCDPQNNQIDNLCLMSGCREHNVAHASLNQCVADLIKMNVLSFDRKSKKYFVRKN